MPTLMTGNARHSLDDKYRMRIPAKFREGIGTEPYIVIGRTGCLYVFPKEKYETVLNSIESDRADAPYVDDARSFLMTLLRGYSEKLEDDGQGRSRIMKDLRDVVGIDKEIVFVGKGDYLEIWPAETWDEKFNISRPENRAALLDALKNYGLGV